MIKTYTYKLYNNKKYLSNFERWVSVCRYVYNLAKETKEESYKKGINVSNYNLQKQLTECKKEFGWLRDVHSQTLQGVLDRLDSGYNKFYKDLKRGVKTNKPKWAKKGKWKSIPFKSVQQTEKGFNLPKFGKVKVFKNKVINGKLKTATLVKEADGLYLKVVVEKQEVEKIRESQSICSIDMGITHFYVSSDGEYIENPRHLFNYLKKLRVENRSLARKKKGSYNWKKQVNKLQKLHQKVSRVRKDFLHKKSRELANSYDYVVREDLNVSEMVQNSSYSKHISDCSWGTFFQLLDYKTEVIKVNPAYSSQECSKCGHTCKENRKTQSLFECVRCNYTENADYQATLNLLKRGHSLLEVNVGQ